MDISPITQDNNLATDQLQRPQEINNQPPQRQLNAIIQQNPIRRIGTVQPNEVNNGWNTPRNRIAVLLMILFSLGIGQTIKGLITNNNELAADGVYGTIKALMYTALAGCVLHIFG